MKPEWLKLKAIPEYADKERTVLPKTFHAARILGVERGVANDNRECFDPVDRSISRIFFAVGADEHLSRSEFLVCLIEVGIRVNVHQGISFFGTEEINDLLRQGKRVVAVEPGGAIMRKLGEDANNVRLTLSGFSLKVKIEDT